MCVRALDAMRDLNPVAVRWGGAGVAALAGLALLPAFTARTDILNVLVVLLISVALAQSWNILGGLAGQVNLGHAAFFGAGALVARLLWFRGVPVPLAVGAGAATAMALGLIIGVPAFRLRGAYFAIGTLGLAEILRITVGNVLPVISALPAPYVQSYSLVPRYYVALGLAAVSVAVAAALAYSGVSYGFGAIREDEDAAAAAGVGPLAHKILAMVASTGLAGLAGGIFAYYHASYYYAHPFSPIWTFDALIMTFIGGVGTVAGPVLGAAFYVLLKEVLVVRLVETHLLIFGALFILVVLTLPGGLLEALHRVARLWRPRPAA